MKKVFLCLASVLAFYGCQKSLEEQAQEAVKNELRTSLYHFDSYEPLKTEVDSAFNEPINNPIVLDLIKGIAEEQEEFQIKELALKLELAESSIGLWSDSRGYDSYALNSYNEAVKDKADAEDKMKAFLKKTWRNMLELSRHIEQADSAFIGWRVKHSYRAKTRGGDPDIGHGVYIFSEDFKKLLFHLENEEYNSLIKVVGDLRESLPARAKLEELIQKEDKMTDAEWRPLLEKARRSVK